MTMQEAYMQLVKDLQRIYDDREAANIADWVFEHVTNHKKIDRIINKNVDLNPEQEELLNNYTNQLLQHKPVQYVLNEAYFAGMKLYVDEAVLVPRPETEELVDWIEEEIRNKKYEIRREGEEERDTKYKKRNKEAVDKDSNLDINISDLFILDVGTGSGCIPLALKNKFSGAEVSAIDVSEDALKVARKNVATYDFDINFQQLDFLKKEQWKTLGKYDIIVSNPPYIKQSEGASMHQNVLAHEPHIALFVPDEDSLIFYKALVQFAQTHLNENGKLFVEINEALGKQVIELFAKSGLKDVEIKKDLQGKDRMVKGTL